MKSLFYSLLAVCMLVLACKKDIEKPVTDKHEKIKIGETIISQKKIILWADEALKAGYSPIYFSIENSSGNPVTDAQITMKPVMDMGSMKHSAPVVQPLFDVTSGFYSGAVVFTMASGTHAWYIETSVNDETHLFEVKVDEEKTKTTGNYTASNGEAYVVSLVKPVRFQTGLNDFQIFVSKKENMMSFVPVEDLTVEFQPEMPSMGHGSPNNVAPVSIGKGYYRGKVNYTMTGDWRLHFKLKSNNTVLIEDATIDILF